MTSSGTVPRGLTHSDVCISIINGETFDRIRPEPVYAIKIRGGFSNEQLAGESAKQIRETDPDHDILIGQLGEWLSLDHRRYCHVNCYEQPILDEIMNPKTRETSTPNSSESTSGSEEAKSEKTYEFTIDTLPATDVDHLSVDRMIHNQSVFCFSYITADQLCTELASEPATDASTADARSGATGTTKESEQSEQPIHCFKVHGIFATKADAQRFAGSIKEGQDIFMAEVGKWSILDCRLNKTVDSEQAINRLVRFICDERNREKLEFQERLRVENMAAGGRASGVANTNKA